MNILEERKLSTVKTWIGGVFVERVSIKTPEHRKLVTLTERKSREIIFNYAKAFVRYEKR